MRNEQRTEDLPQDPIIARVKLGLTAIEVSGLQEGLCWSTGALGYLVYYYVKYIFI